MNGFVGRVVNGKIFKNIASFVRGESQESQEAIERPWTADCGTFARPRASKTPSTRINSDFLGNNRKRRASELNCASSLQSTSRMDFEHYQRSPGQDNGREVWQNHLRESRSSLPEPFQSRHIHANRPPLTSRYLAIFNFQGELGEVGSGLALTENLVWQLNAVYRCENQINECAEAIREIDEKLAEWRSLLSDLQELIDSAANKDNRESLLEGLQDAERMVMLNEQKKILLLDKYQSSTVERELPLRQMLENLYVVLETNDLLEETHDEKGVNFQGLDDDSCEGTVSASLPTPSSSQVAQRILETERRAAREKLHQGRLRVQEAQAKLENWNEHCGAEYEKFLRLQSAGFIDATTTDFDIEMVRHGQIATRACIEAEDELDKVKEQARILRLDFEEFDQESGFLSQIEDGQIESMDPAKIHTFDTERIERWILGNGESRDLSRDVDEWVCKSVGMYDSVSIVGCQVATGKQRKRIDRWRSECEAMNKEVNGQIDERLRVDDQP